MCLTPTVESAVNLLRKRIAERHEAFMKAQAKRYHALNRAREALQKVMG